MAHGAANERQQIVIPERALQAAVVKAEQADEQRFHARNGKRIPAQKDAAADAVVSIEKSVNSPESQNGVEQHALVATIVHVNQDVTDEKPEPADFDGDRFGG